MTAILAFALKYWKFIAIGIAVIVLAGVLVAAKHRYDEGLREEGRAELRPQLAASQAAERQREAETKACVDAAATQSAAVLDAEKRAKDAQAESAKAIAAAREQAKQNAARIGELQKIAAAAPRAKSCEETLKAADAIAREAAMRRRK